MLLVGSSGTSTTTSTVTQAEALPIASAGSIPPGGQIPASALLDIDWDFIEIDGFSGQLTGVIPVPGFRLSSYANRIGGSTGCNPMTGGFVLDVVAGTLSFTDVRNTDMMCSDAQADTEDAVTDAMLATDAFAMPDGNLELRSKGARVAVLSRHQP